MGAATNSSCERKLADNLSSKAGTARANSSVPLVCPNRTCEHDTHDVQDHHEECNEDKRHRRKQLCITAIGAKVKSEDVTNGDDISDREYGPETSS